MTNFAGSMPVGRTSFEHFVFEHFGLFIDLSHDGTTAVAAAAVVAVPFVSMLKATLFS